jgi:sortase A
MRVVERLAWAGGLVALGLWAGAGLTRTMATRAALDQFATARAAAVAAPPSGPLTERTAPDQQLWSPIRIKAWTETLRRPLPTPLAVLRISRLKLEVPVLEGTDDWTLDRAVGHIAETAAPGENGNSGIAGHRDSFFRALKDIAVGDAVELETLRGADTYRVERVWIVAPEDVAVLDPTPARSITLVTCYPFYFVGSAPQRYIVRAVRVPYDARK